MERIKNVIEIFPKSNMQANDYDNSGTVPFFTSSSSLAKFCKTALYPGDSIVMGTGGKATINYSDVPFSTSTDCLSFRCKEKVSTKYLYYYLLSKLDLINGVGFQGIGIKHLQKDYILNMVFDAKYDSPKMISYLDKNIDGLEALINNEKEQIKKLNEYKVAYITEMIGDQLGNNCKKMRLRWLSSLISKGTTPSTIGRETLSDGPIRFLRAENIQNNKMCFDTELFIDEETNRLLLRSSLKENDVLFVIAGATIGKTAILEKQHLPANTNQAISFIRLKDSRYAKYIWYFLQSGYVRKELSMLSVQSAQPNISMEDLGNFFINIYDLKTTNEIVNRIDEKCEKINALIDLKHKKITLLQEFKKALIHECVTGKKEILS